ncbi:MAG: hypothetical protein OEM84_14215 [Acidimicrobiia bacterium]|nr:hypothetical protein [Acidimicrobiia bacterium]
MTVKAEYEHVDEGVATQSVSELTPDPGVREALELYEAAVRYYSTAIAASPVAKVSSTSSAQAAAFPS